MTVDAVGATAERSFPVRVDRAEHLFDATADSLHQPFDEHGREHMQFLHHYGEFDDLAYDQLIAIMAARHPGMFAAGSTVPGEGSLADEGPDQRTSPTG